MNHPHLNLKLSAIPMIALLWAQFLSALADNALLVAAIALMKSLGQLDHISWVQTGFLLPYVLLAPFVGMLADAWPKGRVLLLGNLVKWLGTACMLLGTHPVLAYMVVGIGATLYSPAKYGILSQFFHPDKLVKANALLEGSTIAAILLGVVAGGWLADKSIDLAMWVILGIYALAILINVLIPRLPPVASGIGNGTLMVRSFGRSVAALWHDPAARASLLGTSLFWGCGATLRLMLFVWVPQALHINNNQTPANMMGVLSVGIVAGSMLAWYWIRLENVHRALMGGLLIGPVVAVLALQTSLLPAYVWLLLLGMAGGVFVVPLNALLQQRGRSSVGAGQALAIQNLFENMMMLVMVSAYGALSAWPVTPVIVGLGLVLAGGIGWLARTFRL